MESKCKIKIQIVIDRLKLTPEQLSLFKGELIPLYEEHYEKFYKTHIEEKCDSCSDYDNGYSDGYEEEYYACKEELKS